MGRLEGQCCRKHNLKAQQITAIACQVPTYQSGCKNQTFEAEPVCSISRHLFFISRHLFLSVSLSLSLSLAPSIWQVSSKHPPEDDAVAPKLSRRSYPRGCGDCVL